MPRVRPPGPLATALLVARLTLVEVVRGRAARGLLVVSAALLALFALAAHQALGAARGRGGTVTVDVVGGTLLGSAAFVALLLGATVAGTLTASAVRGDAERGALGPLAARPVSRLAIVLGRTLAGAGLAAAFAIALWLTSVLVVRIAGDWSPPALAGPALALGGAVALVALGGTVVSTALPTTAATIAVLATVGVGLSVGLVAQLGSAFGLADLRTVADVAAALLPFEALYRHVLAQLSDGRDLAAVGVAIGPFGGARELAGWHAPVLAGWTAAALALVAWRVRRSDV